MTTTESRLSRNGTLRSVVFADFRSGRLSREDAVIELYQLDDQSRNLIAELESMPATQIDYPTWVEHGHICHSRELATL